MYFHLFPPFVVLRFSRGVNPQIGTQQKIEVQFTWQYALKNATVQSSLNLVWLEIHLLDVHLSEADLLQFKSK